jgi:homoserine O-acetyltransferase
LWLYSLLEEPIITHPAYNNGFYKDADALQSALRHIGHGTALTLPPPGFYSELHETWRKVGMASHHDFVSQFWEAYWLAQDPNCVVVQARKARAADPASGGDMAEALGRISAKAFIAGFVGDPMFPPEECQRDAERIANAQFWKFESEFGHLATFALSDNDRANIDLVIQTALDAD